VTAASNAGDGLIFAVGLEDTAIGVPLRHGGQRLDEYELTGHRQQWRADLALARDTGASAIRYGLPWYQVNPAPGVFDWTWADEVIGHLAGEAGMRIILDLIHYGTPAWLAGVFADPGYPAAAAEYAAAAASRYRGIVAAYTPLNEPLVTASFCGLRGVWPPYLAGDDGWAQIVTAVAAGVQASVRAIREADSAAQIVHVEAVQAYQTADPLLAGELLLQQRRSELPTRLILGQVGPDDPMWSWLARHGISDIVLERLADQAVSPDVLGLNYYPELSCRELIRLGGDVVQVTFDGGTEQLEEVLRHWQARYGLPLMITETAVEGSSAHKRAWLDDLVGSLHRLRRDGVNVLGLTWWPMVDFVDWGWASGGEVVEEFYRRDAESGQPRPVEPAGVPGGPVTPFLRRMGIYRLQPSQGGQLNREPTGLLAHFRSLANEESARTGGRSAAGDTR
jgi:beta-glucosidase/6-phospho-beta-glucosidase/beta-galactosidase